MRCHNRILRRLSLPANTGLKDDITLSFRAQLKRILDIVLIYNTVD